MKIKWIVAPAPTGPYKSFRNRGWPSAFSPDGNSAMFAISCSDEYVPKKVKNGWHKPLKLRIADHTGHINGWTWRTLNYEFSTLDELKQTAQKFADKNPHLFMNEGQET
jgi:hypothetical protein